MKIYHIDAKQLYPVGDAGAVVIAKSGTSALKLAIDCGLTNPDKPECIGIAGKKETKERVVFFNTTEY